MKWFDINDRHERGVLEIGDYLELALLIDGRWIWRDALGRTLALAKPVLA